MARANKASEVEERRQKQRRSDNEARVYASLRDRNKFSKVIVNNVYGDAYRINYYVTVPGVDTFVETMRLVKSEFVKQSV